MPPASTWNCSTGRIQGHDKLMAARNQLLGLARKDPNLTQVRANGLDDEPQYEFSIDWEKASALGLTINDINTTLSTAWGSQYVDDFIDRGRVKRVFVQGDASSRMLPQDLTDWYVRNANLQMVPFLRLFRCDLGIRFAETRNATMARPRWKSSAHPRPASVPAPRSMPWSAT